MGTWGVDLYADDTAGDVRDAFIEALKDGLSGQAAADRVLASRRSSLDQPQLACCVYFALADTAWRRGCLTDSVKRTALALLESGGDVSIWQQDAPQEARARQAVLQRLEAQLRSPQPAARPFPAGTAAAKTVHTDAPTGSAYVLPLPSGHRGALVIVGFKDLGHSLDPVFSVARWRGVGDEVPPLAHLAQRGTLRMPSFLKSHAHVGIIPPDGPPGFMSRLQPVGVIPQPWPFDPSDAIWLSIGRVAKEVDRQLAGQVAGGVS
jgi:hypothetical protein